MHVTRMRSKRVDKQEGRYSTDGHCAQPHARRGRCESVEPDPCVYIYIYHMRADIHIYIYMYIYLEPPAAIINAAMTLGIINQPKPFGSAVKIRETPAK